MTRRRGGQDERDRTEQAPMLGVLSVLLLLIPALMLMAHVTAYAQIDVSTPRYGGEDKSSTISCGRDPQFHVAIAQGAFFTKIDADGWTRVGASATGYDHAALADVVWDFKQQFPHSTVAYVSAQSDVDYETLVATIDTVRGPDCRLAGAFTGEEIPDECLLWTPIIEHRTPNWDVPKVRQGEVWPPLPPRALGADE